MTKAKKATKKVGLSKVKANVRSGRTGRGVLQDELTYLLNSLRDLPADDFANSVKIGSRTFKIILGIVSTLRKIEGK